MRMPYVRSTLAVAAIVAVNTIAEQVRFDQPRHGGHRLDACRSFGAGCGQDAADAFCTTQGFQKAIGFEIDRGIGAVTPTMTIVDRRICNDARCDGFKWIKCERSGPPAPAGRGAPPPASRHPRRYRGCLQGCWTR